LVEAGYLTTPEVMGLLDTFETNSRARYALAGVIGALLGMVASFTVNCTLVEISINGFFAVYFGVLFILIAGIILYRVMGGTHPKPFILTSLALVVFASGLLCFSLQRDWFVRLPPMTKVPVYAILGISITFSLLFAVIDLINHCSSEDPNSRPIIETEQQVYLVVATAVSMGFIFGLVFGLLDIEDEQISHIKVALLREERICYPIGAIMGGVAAVWNQHMRETAASYKADPLKDNTLDDEDL